MTDMLMVVTGLSTPVKIAWVDWMMWGVGQLLWYRRSRNYAPPAYVPPPPPPRLQSSAARRPVAVPVPRAGSPEFLAALEEEQQALREGGLQTAPSSYS